MDDLDKSNFGAHLYLGDDLLRNSAEQHSNQKT